MCGIFGAYRCIDARLMQQMSQALRHRGPDDEGAFHDDEVWLGHRRLSIIDLTTGRQPICNEDKRIWTVYNGEIYNYLELKQELASFGHRFATGTDTEVIVHAYEQWGVTAFTRFNGIFAFALWDARQQRLFLVRDRLGVKPLYYAQYGNKLFFASELAALLNCPGVDRERLVRGKLSEFMVFRHASGPQTIVEGIRKLLPGTYLAVHDGAVSVARYWTLGYRPTPMDEHEAADALLGLLRKAVHSQLMADVPLGVLLSGGLDSGAIVALASESSRGLHTFSIEFAGDRLSELSSARKIANRFGTQHRELTVQPADLSLIPEIIRCNDEPVAGPSSLAYYLMLEKIRACGIKVVLLGHGADEILGGYEHVKMLLRLRRLGALPSLGRFAGLCLWGLARAFPQDECLARMHRLFTRRNDPDRSYVGLYAVFDPEEISRLLGPEALDAEDYLRPISEHTTRGLGYADAVSAYEFGPWLSDDLLLRMDRMCMAHSIEGRVPFLDNDLVAFCCRVPYDLKVRGGIEKYLFKQAVRDVLPVETLNRPKQRFTTPLDQFFGPRLMRICKTLFEEKNFLNEEYFDKKFLLGLLDFARYPSYRFILKRNRLLAQYYSRQIWTVLTMHLWYKTVVQGDDCSGLFGEEDLP